MFLSACNPMPTFESFKDKSPTFSLRSYFDGPLEAWGFLQDRSGEVTRRFQVTMTGAWTGDTGTLTEHFVYDDGEEQDRIWTIKELANGQFEATAPDVIGIATARQQGNALNMEYVLRVPVKGTTYDITINDWLILLDQKRLINISALTKFGINVGRLTIYFEKK